MHALQSAGWRVVILISFLDSKPRSMSISRLASAGFFEVCAINRIWFSGYLAFSSHFVLLLGLVSIFSSFSILLSFSIFFVFYGCYATASPSQYHRRTCWLEHVLLSKEFALSPFKRDPRSTIADRYYVFEKQGQSFSFQFKKKCEKGHGRTSEHVRD